MAATVQAPDGVDIAYEVPGDPRGGPFAVVFVHGWAGNRTFPLTAGFASLWLPLR